MTKRMNYTLWSIQWLLALLYLFAGAMKLILPIAELTKQIAFPGVFVRFIGTAEVPGALGLILPGLTGIGRELTPLAAAGLFIIMIRATIVMLRSAGLGSAMLPLVAGLLDVFVAWGRSKALQQKGSEPCWSTSQS